MFSNLFHNFNGTAFSDTLIARKAERYIGKFLDDCGPKMLKGCIERKMWLTDCLTEEFKVGLKQKSQNYKDMFPGFTNIKVYGWIPQRHRDFIEALPGGKEWALGQLQVIREYLSS